MFGVALWYLSLGPVIELVNATLLCFPLKLLQRESRRAPEQNDKPGGGCIM